MKKLLTVGILCTALISCDTMSLTQAVQTANSLLIPSNSEVASGLKEALTMGIQKGVGTLSSTGGFLNNPLVKIPLPDEVKKVESAMRTMGLGSTVDNAIKAINTGAEQASKEALQVFVGAVRDMSFQDAMGILTGGNSAATNFLRNTTTQTLTEKFRPIIEKNLQSVGATKYWADVMNGYNLVSKNKINPDLNAYVTQKALTALFLEVEKQENDIRNNPTARTTDLLKRVFNYADTKK